MSKAAAPKKTAAKKAAATPGMVSAANTDTKSHIFIAVIGLFLGFMGYTMIPSRPAGTATGAFVIFCAGAMTGAAIRNLQRSRK